MSVHTFSFNTLSTLQLTQLVFVLVSGIFGLLIIARRFQISNGGYDRCFHCRKSIGTLRRLYSRHPFCSKECKVNDAATFRREAISRLWNETSGEMLVEDALMYGAVALIFIGDVHFYRHVLVLVFHHVQHYAACSAPPGGCL